MKLNLSILAHELSDLNPRLFGEPEQELNLADVRLFSNQKKLSPEHVYLLTPEKLGCLDDHEAKIICIGGDEEVHGKLAERDIFALLLDSDADINEVLERVQDVFLHFNDLEDELTENILREAPLNVLVDLSAKFFRNHVFMLDSALRFIACSANYSNINATEVWRESFSSGIISPTLINILNRNGLTSLLHQSTAALFMEREYGYGPGISVNCIWQEHRVATLCVVQTHNPVSPGQLGLADYLAAMLTKEVLRSQGNVFSSRSQLRDYLKRMIQGMQADRSIIGSQLSALGWKLDDDYLLLRIPLPHEIFMNGTLEHSKKIYESLFPGCISVHLDDTLVILVRGKTTDATITSGLAALTQYLKDIGAHGAMSLSFADLTMLREHFVLAGVALDLGSRDECFHRYADVVMKHLVSECAKVLPLRALCHPQVLKIQELDQQGGGSLLLSLQVYLQYERSLKTAAEKLHIHRNTLVYRLERISKIADLDLDNPQTRIHILHSCMILSYLNELSSRPGNGQTVEMADAG